VGVGALEGTAGLVDEHGGVDLGVLPRPGQRGVGAARGEPQLLDVAEALGLGAELVVLAGLRVEGLEELEAGAQPRRLARALVAARLPLLEPGADVGEPLPRRAVLREERPGAGEGVEQLALAG